MLILSCLICKINDRNMVSFALQDEDDEIALTPTSLFSFKLISTLVHFCLFVGGSSWALFRGLLHRLRKRAKASSSLHRSAGSLGKIS